MTDFSDDQIRRARIMEEAREAIERGERQKLEHEMYLKNNAHVREAAREYADETNRRKQESQKRLDEANERAAEQERAAQHRARAELELMERQSAGRRPKIFYRDI